ncbi:sugar transferase [Salinivibrio kushneri]|uniref:Sugar transferase n=1 Tax=Salinivibrio kushneri TaxID=1908198 RepID=A0AB36K644_9GAMM|nr:sugar transferase [Salinivibrio kushneri]OOE43968.1 sugar transferase [Salinivibrio kushneri]
MSRVFDVVVSFFLIVVLSPVIAFIAWRIKSQLGSPVLFHQERPGLGGKPFDLIKFRTMADLRDSKGSLLPDERRLTPFGRFLRASSLDELPELWNVLKGDMGLVGPRPLLMDYLPLYTKHEARRHEVRPGITGWAQVNGRNAISWDEKFKLDIWYIDNRSFWLDIKILILTVKKVIAREDITAQGHATTKPFAGTSRDNNNDE